MGQAPSISGLLQNRVRLIDSSRGGTGAGPHTRKLAPQFTDVASGAPGDGCVTLTRLVAVKHVWKTSGVFVSVAFGERETV